MRLVNLRPTLFVSLSFAVGIALAYVGFTNSWLWAILAFSLLAVMVIVFLILKKKVTALLIALLVAFMAGNAAFLCAANVAENRCIGVEKVTLHAVFTDSADSEQGVYILRDVSVTTEDGKSIQLDGQTRMYLNKTAREELGQVRVKAGEQLTCQCTLRDNYLFKDGVDAYNYRDRVYYTAHMVRDISISDGKVSVFESVRIYMRTTFSRFMQADNAAVSLGMVLGDKGAMTDSDKEAFRKTGLAHVFAVSGLHVGFILLLVNTLLNFMGVKVYRRLFYVLPPLLFYVILVGFSPSVCRAAIMCVVSYTLATINRKGDTLTSLAISVLIILAVRPLTLFDVGFIMSVSAVFGIATVTHAVDVAMRRREVKSSKRKIIQLFSLSLGAMLGTSTAIAAVYGEISLVSLPINTIFVPVLTVVFIILIIGLIPFPAVAYLLWLPDKMLQALRFIITKTSQLPYAIIPVSSFGIGGAVLFLLLFVLGGYVNVKKIAKGVVIGALSLVFVVTATISAIPNKSVDTLRYYDGIYNSAILTSDMQGNVSYLGCLASMYEYNDLDEYLDGNQYTNVTVYVTDYTQTDLETFQSFLSDKRINVIKKLTNVNNGAIDDYLNSTGRSLAVYDSLKGGVRVVGDGLNGVCGYIIEVGGARILYADKVYYAVTEQYEVFDAVSVVFAGEQSDLLAELYPSAAMCGVQDGKTDIFDVLTHGDFTILFKNGKICFKQ